MLWSYVGERLSRSSRASLRDHIADCPKCAANIQAHQDLWNTLGEWEPAPISFDFERKLFARIEQEKSRSWLHKAAVTFFPLAARPALPFALALLLVTGFLLERPHQQPAPATPVVSQAVPTAGDELKRELEDLQLLQQFDSTKGKPARNAGSM